MRKNLKEGAKGTDEDRIEVPTHNISLKDIKSPSYHLGDSKADTNHAVEESDFPKAPSR